MWKLALALVFCLAPACSHEVTPPDMVVTPPDLASPLSQCGHPGDKGNSLGIGKFCTRISDCLSDDEKIKTNICSSLGNNAGSPSMDDTYFCTIYPCSNGDGGTGNSCGENATCVCGSGGGMTGCACTPNACLGTPPDLGP